MPITLNTMTIVTLGIIWLAVGGVSWTLFVVYGARFEAVGQESRSRQAVPPNRV